MGVQWRMGPWQNYGRFVSQVLFYLCFYPIQTDSTFPSRHSKLVTPGPLTLFLYWTMPCYCATRVGTLVESRLLQLLFLIDLLISGFPLRRPLGFAWTSEQYRTVIRIDERLAPVTRMIVLSDSIEAACLSVSGAQTCRTYRFMLNSLLLTKSYAPSSVGTSFFNIKGAYMVGI
jgi:hypothetical protein